MSTNEQQFMKEMKALLDKYEVRFTEDQIYYEGENPNPSLHVKGGTTVISLNDIADMRGGFTTT